MAEIKDLGIFTRNKGLDAIKKRAKETANRDVNQKNRKQIISEGKQKLNNIDENKSNKMKQSSVTKKKAKSVGPPIRNFDRVYSASQPVKLSALLNGTTRALTEKYMTSDTKDEILRKALNDYIKHNLTKEDKHDLLNDVSKELDLYRQKFPTIEKITDDGDIIQSVEEIEKETIERLKQSWGLSN